MFTYVHLEVTGTEQAAPFPKKLFCSQNTVFNEALPHFANSKAKSNPFLTKEKQGTKGERKESLPDLHTTTISQLVTDPF